MPCAITRPSSITAIRWASQVRLLQVLRRQQHGHALARERLDRVPDARGGCAGPGPWSARSRNRTCGRTRRLIAEVEAAAHARRRVLLRAGGRSAASARSTAVQQLVGDARLDAAQPGHHPQVLGAGEDAVDRRLLRGEADRGADGVRLADDVVPGDAGGSRVGASSVVRMRTVVVFPAPLGPSSANTSPGRTCRSRPARTGVSPNALVRPSTSIVLMPYTRVYAIHFSYGRGLNVDLVVEAAVAIADEEGLAAVSMASVAKRCGFTTMSLYRHVASKDELVWRMLDRGLGPAPAFTFDGWRDGLRQWAHAFMAMLRLHPWGIDIPINGTLPTRAQLSWLDRGLEVLDGTGVGAGEAADLVLLLNGYVFWAARLETSLAAAPPQPLVPPESDLDAFPYLQRAIAAGVVRGRPAGHGRGQLPARPGANPGRDRGGAP